MQRVSEHRQPSCRLIFFRKVLVQERAFQTLRRHRIFAVRERPAPNLNSANMIVYARLMFRQCRLRRALTHWALAVIRLSWLPHVLWMASYARGSVSWPAVARFLLRHQFRRPHLRQNLPVPLPIPAIAQAARLRIHAATPKITVVPLSTMHKELAVLKISVSIRR